MFGSYVQIEIWSDVVCPWCYIGKRRFERALEQFEHRDGIEVVYRSFELDPAAPRGTTRPTVDVLAGKFGMPVPRVEQMQREMEQRAAADGLEFRLDELHSGNSRDAHRLIHFAKAEGKQAELVERLHRAYFTERASVFDPARLTELAADAGLDRADAETVLQSDRFAADVEQDERLARELGISGVPFFVVDRRYAVSGAQPVEVFQDVLRQVWAATSAA